MSGFDIGIEDTVEEAIRDFGQISKQVKSKAIVRAANRAVKKARTEAGRGVARRYFITKRKVMNSVAFIRRAQDLAGDLTVNAAIYFRGPRLSGTHFEFGRPVNPWNVKGRKHKRRGGGVRVRIKRGEGTKLIAGAFLTQARSGHWLILQRVNRKDPRILRSRRQRRLSPPGRYPVQEVISLAVPQAVAHREVIGPVLELSAEEFKKEFFRQLDLLVKQRTT